MKFLGDFKCPACGWVHVGISRADAIAEVQSFNSYFNTLIPSEQDKFGGTLVTLARYERCFQCAERSEMFERADIDRDIDGCSLQVVIAPTWFTDRH